METTGGDAYWLNGKNERHNRSIHNLAIASILDINQHEKNDAVQQIHHKKSIDEKSTVN